MGGSGGNGAAELPERTNRLGGLGQSLLPVGMEMMVPNQYNTTGAAQLPIRPGGEYLSRIVEKQPRKTVFAQIVNGHTLS